MKLSGFLRFFLFVLIAQYSVSSAAQNKEEIAISYFMKAEKAYSNFKNSDAINNLDKTVEYLGETNPKIEALYVKAFKGKRDYEKAKKHLSRYFEIADKNQSSYQEMLTEIAEIDAILEKKKAKTAKVVAERRKATDAVFAIMDKEKKNLKSKVETVLEEAESNKNYIAERFIKERPESKMLINRTEALRQLNDLINTLNFTSDTLERKGFSDERVKVHYTWRYEINHNELFIYNYGYNFYPDENRGYQKYWHLDYVDLNQIHRIEKGESHRLIMYSDSYVPSLLYQKSNRQYKVPKNFRYTTASNRFLRAPKNEEKNQKLLALLDHIIYLNKAQLAKEYNDKNGALTQSEIESKQKFRPYRTYLKKIERETPKQPLDLSQNKTLRKIKKIIESHHVPQYNEVVASSIRFKQDNLITKQTYYKNRDEEVFNLHDLDSYKVTYDYNLGNPIFNLIIYDCSLPDLLINSKKSSTTGRYNSKNEVGTWNDKIRLAFKNAGVKKENYRSDPNVKEITDLLSHLIYLNRQERVEKIKEMFPNEFE